MALSVCLTGCSDKERARSSPSKGPVVATPTQGPNYIDSQWPVNRLNVPDPMPTREVYPIDEVGRLGSSRLKTAQIDWLKTVISSPYWRQRLGLLYVSPLTEPGSPIVVFYTPPWVHELDADSGYQIVGDPCPDLILLDTNIYAFPGNPPGGGAGRCWRDPLLDPNEHELAPLPIRPGRVSPENLLKQLDAFPTKKP
jgi:hypothetical protein